MKDKYLLRITNYSELLDKLVNSRSIKYSNWPPADTATLKSSSGVYHFYLRVGSEAQSLYVGKATFRLSGWSLYKRLCQHFQASQINALLGKASKSLGQDPSAIKAEFCSGEYYLQWINLSEFNEQELSCFENFCKAVLNPKYTDA